MAPKSNTFESGEASGVAITASNSADPDAFQTVAGNVVYSTAHPAHGSLGMLAQTTAAARSFVEWTLDTTATKSARINLWTDLPDSNHRLLQFGTPAGSCLDLEWRTDGTIRLRNAYATSHFQSQPLPVGQQIRIEVDAYFAEGSGWAKLRIYAGADSMTLLDSFDSEPDLTLRGVPTYLRVGAIDDVANATIYVDDLAYAPGGFIGPVIPPNRPPAVSGHTFKAVPYGKTHTLTTTATDADGSVASYAYTLLEDLTGSAVQLVTDGNECTVKAALPGAVVLQCEVTDDDGASSYVDHVIEFVNAAWTGELGNFRPAFPAFVDENTPTSVSGWTLRAFEDFSIDCAEGEFLSTYPLMDAYPEEYLTTYGGPSGANTGDHYGGDTNLSVADGAMRMRLHRDADSGLAVGAAPYPKFSADPNDIYQLYGRYEVRFRITQAAPGWKTAWLTWPESEVWPGDGEIDFLEGSLDGAKTYFMHRQDGVDGGDQDVHPYPSDLDDGAWHTVVLEWKPGDCAVFCDSVLVGRSTERVPNTPMRMVLQSETTLGEAEPQPIATSFIDVDYIAVWGYEPILEPMASSLYLSSF